MSIIAGLTPEEIVAELDKHIVGQKAAKRAIAVALRNRERRKLVPLELRQEIKPKNILMIGPTGVGKTEIARRIAKIIKAPFTKEEATKFTEIGYIGRDVESMMRNLVEISVKLTRDEAMEEVQERAEKTAMERILQIVSPPPSEGDTKTPNEANAGREIFRKKIKKGELDEQEIEIEMTHSAVGVEILAHPGMEEMTSQIQGFLQNLAGERLRKRRLKIKDAFKLLREEEASKLINDEEIKAKGVARAEQEGIIFVDEIDKITQRTDFRGGADVSREGVQRDLLPLIEGCSVPTKYGTVRTDHVLFIASGAFHLSKPSDLIPELQGRLPIRVELEALRVEEFVRILTEPDACLTVQYKELLATEGVQLKFSKDGIARIAEIAWEINENTENIGARRLHTVMERLLDDISFRATELANTTTTINKSYVDKQLGDLVKDQDLSRFIL